MTPFGDLIVRRRKRMLGVLAVLAFVLAALAASATASTQQSEACTQTFNLKMGSSTPDSDALATQQANKYFIKRLEVLSKGCIKVTYFPNSQLGAEPIMLNGVMSGSLDFANVTPNTVSTVDPNWAALFLPFLIPTRAALYRLLDSKIGTSLLGSLNSKGAHGLYYVDQGFIDVVSKDHPLNTLASFKGAKVRIVPDAVSTAFFGDLNATPVSMAFPQVYTSLQQGVLDAAVASPGAIQAGQLLQVAKYVTLTAQSWALSGTFISQKTYASLPVSYRKDVLLAAKATSAFAFKNGKNVAATDTTNLQKAGANVVKVDAANRNAFAALAKLHYSQSGVDPVLLARAQCVLSPNTTAKNINRCFK